MPTTGLYDIIQPADPTLAGVTIPVWDNGGSATHLQAAGFEVGSSFGGNAALFSGLQPGHYETGGTGTYHVKASATIMMGVVLEMKKGQQVEVEGTYALTVVGEIRAGSYQIFTSGSKVYFSGQGCVIDAAWWGAEPGADATPELQKALDALAYASGEVHLGFGEYVADTLDLSSGTRLLGRGQAATTLRRKDGFNYLNPLLRSKDESAASEGMEIAHLTIDGNRESVGLIGSPPAEPTGDGNAMGIRVVAWTNAHIHDVTIKNCWTDGIYLGGSEAENENANVWVTDCEVTNCRRNNISVVHCKGGGIVRTKLTSALGTAPESGIDIEPAGDGEIVEDFEVDGCQISSNEGNGISVYQAAGGTLRRVTLRGNFIALNGLSGIRVAVAGGESLHGGITIIGNTVRQNGLGTTKWDGIQILSTQATDTDRTLIANNRVEENGRSGIHIEHSAFNVVQGNQVRLNLGSGIFVTSDTSKFNLVTGNLAEANGTQGIYLFASTYNTVTGNTVLRSGAHGIALSTGASHNQVTNNFCAENSQTTTNTSDNILINNDCDYNNVQGNTCRKGALTNQPRYGIRINTSNCDGNLVTNNDLYLSGASGSLSDAGTGTVTAAGNR